MNPTFRACHKALKLLSSDSRLLTIIRSFSILILIAAVAMPAAKISWKLIGGFTPNSSDQTAVPPHAKLNNITKTIPDVKKLIVPLFGEALPAASTETAVSLPKHEYEQYGDLPLTSLNLVLKGLISSPQEKLAVAIINTKESKEPDGIYAVGDEVPGQAVVKSIHPDRVILSRSGKLETLLFMADSSAETKSELATIPSENTISLSEGVVSKGDGVNWKIDRTFLDQQLTNIPAIAKQIRLNAFKEGEELKGYRLAAGRGSQLLSQLGLQSGDVLLEINGTELSDTSKAVKALQTFRDSTEINIVIDRMGTRKNLVYSVQ